MKLKFKNKYVFVGKMDVSIYPEEIDAGKKDTRTKHVLRRGEENDTDVGAYLVISGVAFVNRKRK